MSVSGFSVLTSTTPGRYAVAKNIPASYGDSVNAAHFDGDGDQDLFISGDRSPSVILYNDGSGKFFAPTRTEPGDLTLAVTADFNEDGLADVIGPASYFHPPTVALNDGAGGFDLTTIALPGVDRILAPPADVNADGHVDIVLGVPTDQAAVLAGDGLGGFTLLPPFHVGAVRDLAIEDADNDGDLDLAYVSPRHRSTTI